VIVLTHLLASLGVVFFSNQALLWFFILHFVTGGLGLVIGFHRLLSHKSFGCPRWLQRLFALFGTLALQEGPIRWASHHRAHHRFNDGPGDPHDSTRGFWWSHLLWLTYFHPNGFRKASVRVNDLQADPVLRFLDRNMFLVNIVFFAGFVLLIPKLDVLIWAFPVRIVVVWHTVWAINSYVHHARFTEPFADKPAKIRDSVILSLLMYGDGWHKTHHDHPGLVTPNRPYLDVSYWVLKTLQAVGLVQLRHIRQKIAIDA